MALREVIAEFDIRIPTGKIAGARKQVDGAAESLRNYAQVYSSAEIVSGIKAFFDGMVAQGTQLEDQSAQLGLTTDELQRYGLAAQLSGSSQEGLAKGIAKLQQNMEGGSKAFDAIGVSLRNADGSAKSTSQVMREAGLAIGALEDSSERTKRAIELFGREGNKLVPMFADGAEGLDKMLSELDRLGGGLSSDAIKAIGKFDDEMVRWDFQMRAVKSQIALSVMPTVSGLATKVIEAGRAFSSGEDGARRLKVALTILGVAGAAAGISMLAPWIPMALVLAGLYLVVEDLVTALDGGDSAIKRLIDAAFGEGTGASIFAAIKEDIDALNESLKKEPETGVVEGTFKSVGESIRSFFADEIPEAVSGSFDRVANGTASAMDKFVVGFVESLKTTLLGVPIYFATAAVSAARKFWATLTAEGKEGLDGFVELAKSAGTAFSDALAEAITMPSLDIGGFRDTTPGERNANGDQGNGGGIGLGDAAGVLGGGIGAAGRWILGSKKTASFNQTINNSFDSRSPFLRGDVMGAIDESNQAALGYLEAVGPSVVT